MNRILLKALLHPLKTIAIINRRYFQFFHRNRDPELSFMKGWVYGDLKRVDISEVFPGIEQTSIRLHHTFARTNNMSLTVFELCNLLSIINWVNAKKVVEIGTYDGGTTVNIAANLPSDGVVYTVDLPPQSDNKTVLEISGFNNNSIEGTVVGNQYLESPYSDKVRQILVDSANLTLEQLDGGAVDLAFIDGCHDKAYVRRDTQLALEYSKKGSVIVWHDYGMIKDVSQVIDELAQHQSIVCLRGCRLAVMIVQ